MSTPKKVQIESTWNWASGEEGHNVFVIPLQRVQEVNY